jgi:HNH endonuclease
MGLPKTYCTVDDCKRQNFGLGLCSLHYKRMRNHGSTEKPPRPRRPFFNTNGYVYEYVDGRRQPELQHRLIMERKLGRKLRKGENVHHRNGIKSDNREDNLELWVSWQPHGCRVEDLLKFAHKIIETYEPEFIGKQLMEQLIARIEKQ